MTPAALASFRGCTSSSVLAHQVGLPPSGESRQPRSGDLADRASRPWAAAGLPLIFPGHPLLYKQTGRVGGGGGRETKKDRGTKTKELLLMGPSRRFQK